MSDLGVTTVALNQIDHFTAKGQIYRANRALATSVVLLAAFIGVAALAAITATVLFLAEQRHLFPDMSTFVVEACVIALVGDAALTLITNHWSGLFRSIRRYDLTVNWQTASRSAGAVMCLVAAIMHGDPLDAALVMIATRCALLTLMMLHLSRRVDWLKLRHMRASGRTAMKMLKDGASFVLLPVSNILYLHVSVVAVGMMLGPIAVASFSTVRNFTRLIPQFVAIVGRSVWSETTRAAANNDTAAVARMIRGVLWATCSLTGCVSLAYFALGPWAFQTWTGGQVNMPPLLLPLFIINSAGIAIYTSLEVFSLSTNTHKKYATVFFAITALQTTASVALLPSVGSISFPIFGIIACIATIAYLFIPLLKTLKAAKFVKMARTS